MEQVGLTILLYIDALILVQGLIGYLFEVLTVIFEKNGDLRTCGVKIRCLNHQLEYNSNIFTLNNSLWGTSCVVDSLDSYDNELLACNAVEIDITNPEKSILTNEINIPGKLMGISKDGKTLFTEHKIWDYENIPIGKKF